MKHPFVPDGTALTPEPSADVQMVFPQLHASLQHLPVAVFVVKGSNFLVHVANPGFCSLAGKSETALLGNSFFTLFPHLKNTLLETAFHHAFKSGSPQPATNVPQVSLQPNQWASVQLQPITGSEGAVLGLIGVATSTMAAAVNNNLTADTTNVQLIPLLDALPHLAWIAQPSGAVIFANKQVQLFDAAAAGNWHWTNLAHPADRAATTRLWQEALNNGTGYRQEHRLLMANGRYRWHLSQALPHKDSSGAIVQWLGTATDVHSQKEAEQQLHEKDTLVYTVLESSPDCVKLLDKEGRVQYMNRNGLQLMEVDDFNQVANRHWWEFGGAENEEKLRSAIAQALNNTTAHLQAFCPTTKGVARWWDVVISPVTDSNGKIARLLSISKDITEQKLAEGRLQQLSRHLQFSTSAAQAGTWEVNLATQQLHWSALHKQIWGYPENFSNVTPAIWQAAIVPDDVDRVLKHFAEAGRHHLPVDVAYRIKRVNDGSVRWVRSIGSFTYSQNSATGISGICLDITAQKEAEEKLRQSEARFRHLFYNAPVAIWEEDFSDAKSHVLALRQQGITDLDAYFAENKDELLRLIANLTVHDVNEAAMEMYGGTKEELQTGLPLFFVEDTLPTFIEELKVIAAGGGRFETETVVRRKCGEQLDVLVRIDFPANDDYRSVQVILLDITERKKGEAALRKLSTERAEALATLESLLENAPIGFAFFDLHHRYLRINDTLADINGIPAAEHIGKTIEELLPENAKTVVPVLDQIVRTKKPVLNMEVRGETLKAPGVTRYWLTGFYPVLNERQDEVVSVGAVVTEITDRRNAEEMIRESEIRFRTLADTLPQMVWMMDADGTIEFASQEWRQYSGIEDVSTAWESMIHPDDYVLAMQSWEKNFAAGQSYRQEVRLKNKNGEYRWHLSVAETVKDEEDNVIKWIGALMDIHVQKTFVEKLEMEVAERTRELQKATLQLKSLNAYLLLQNQTFTHAEEASGQGSYYWDLRSGTLSYSDNFYRLLGCQPGAFEPDSETFLGFVHPNDQAYVKAATQSSWESQQAPDELSYRIVRSDGIVRHVQVTGRTVTADGDPVIIGTLRDITEDVLLRQRLEANNLELERSNADLQQFAHVASHDLKEPVRKIRFFGSCLSSEFGHQLPDKAKQYLQKMENAATRMYSMVEGVLQYSALNEAASETETVVLEGVLRSIEADLELIVREKQARISYEKLPAIHGYPVLIHQLFYNLINNALKFSRPDVPPQILISAQVEKAGADGRTEAIISVQDNGIGFGQQHATQIFKTFARLNPKDEYEGTGLGLALCKKIAERHGGSISASGTEGKGATFTVVLPAAEA